MCVVDWLLRPKKAQGAKEGPWMPCRVTERTNKAKEGDEEDLRMPSLAQKGSGIKGLCSARGVLRVVTCASVACCVLYVLCVACSVACSALRVVMCVAFVV